MSSRTGARGSDTLRRRLRLTVITDRALAGDEGWLGAVRAALEAGATAVQLRDKGASSRRLLEMARAARRLAERHGALFIVNDRFDIALAAGADGVHLGDADIPVDEVRRVVPRGFVVGRSADTAEAARKAEAAGASYLGVGAVFGTRTKPEVRDERIGVERVEHVVRAVSIPVVGIGGITPANAAAVLETGAAGVAVVSAIMAASDPGAAARALLSAMGARRARGK